MALLTPAEFVKLQIENRAKLEQAKLDYAALVGNYDALASKIIVELSQVEADLDTLRDLEGIAFGEGKENAQRINGFFGFTVSGNIATTKMNVRNARQSIVKKG
jgi:hypothetical protein